jgi:hypothetical protein
MLDAFLENKPSTSKEEQKVIEDDFNSKILKALNPFSTFGYLPDESQTLLNRIMVYFQSEQTNPQLSLDILEILVLAAKVETFNHHFHQSLVFASFALQNINNTAFNLRDALQWEII